MPDTNAKVGEKIRGLRIEKELSVEEVAKRSGISESNIAKIEDNEILPPLGNIVSLAKAFGVEVGDLFGDSADSPFCIVRGDDREKVSRFNSLERTSSGYSYESLGHQKKNRHMEPFLVTLSPTETPQVETNHHIGEEIIFVLEGKVEVKILDHTDILNPGDSIYYDSNMPHIVSCHGDKPATILAVIYAKDEMLIL